MYAIPADREQPVQEMFSAIARRYDLNNTLLSFGLHHLWKEHAVREARVPVGGRAADLCAGTCDIAALLARRMGPHGHVDALDLNQEMLDVGAEKLRRAGLATQVNVTRGNMESLPFESNRYDAATVGFGVRNVVRRQQAFAEMVRILKPGGRAVCLEFSRPVNPLWRQTYEFYNFSILPRIGSRVARDTTRVYEYLPASIAQFPAQEDLAQMMRDSGFSRVHYVNLCGGIVALHVGVK
ncbi:MAG: bifunctional demethylmenaquinone methyltransferase/2-methoxy-6-polyprenyl-1,4-benzoquinol methylase UbiE [Nitrospirota bacterium]|nr:bifunctional demethylmenaquinone methyltransferase/2-methoxy-6-polyprenyl-1,4-benzoquinol methylase UbiE [Nitrospirota bacterium]